MTNYKIYNYPKPIESFFELFDKEEFNTDESIDELEKIISKIYDYLKAEYSIIFKGKRLLDNNYIQETIFIGNPKKLGERQFIKLNLSSAINVLQSLIDGQNFERENYFKENSNYNGYKSKLNSFYYFVDDFIQFYGNYMSFFHRNDKTLIMQRKMESFNIYDSIEMSSQLLNGNIDLKYYSMSKVIPGAIPFIRLTLELILKNSLNIHNITKKSGTKLKISGFMFLEFFKQNEEQIKFPAKFSLLRKVYEWSNYFIHSGEITYYWIIWEAQHILYSFFPFKPEFDNSHYILFDQILVDNINELLTNFISSKLNLQQDDIVIEFRNSYGGLTLNNKNNV